MKKLVTLLGIFAVATGIQAVAVAQNEPPPPNVRVSQASLQSLAPSTLVPGTVISRNDAKLAAEVTGRLIEVAEVGTVAARGGSRAAMGKNTIMVPTTRAPITANTINE